MNISQKDIIKFLKLLFSRAGSMVLFSTLTSIIIFWVTMNDHLDEFTSTITSAKINDITNTNDSNISSLSPAISPFVEKKIVTNIQETSFPTIKVFSPYLDEGQTIVCPGTPGKIITTHEQILVNKKLVTTNLLSGNEVKPTPQKILIGIRHPIVHNITSIPLDNNGCPLNYKSVLPNRIATAYTAEPGSRTSTGKIPRVGYVSVNPKVIPYHSVLYIKSCHRNFSGIFIAEDTGGAMRRGQADIDVFMSTKNECMIFGRQKINIYILTT